MTTTAHLPSTDRWPRLEAVPSGPGTAVAAAVARRLFETRVRRAPVTVHLEGRTLGSGGPTMTVRRPDEFFARVGRGGLVGFGESYLTGAWDSDDLAGFLSVLAESLPSLVPAPLQRLRSLVVRRVPAIQRGTRDNARRNVAHHYDLSNDLFGHFLDETMTYSAALFDVEPAPADDTRTSAPITGSDLASGQARKLDRLLDRTGVGPGTRVLEIGSGWGELAIRAARRGAVVRAVTLSRQQQELAEHRIAAAGVADLVTVDLLDYRDLASTDGHPTYDVVLSVEMIEAVGHEFWGEYFEILDRVTAPGGRVGLQAITMPHDRMLATRDNRTWINKYIFPGGFLPSLEAIDRISRTRTTLRVDDRLSFGSHYAETLRQWDERFRAARESVLGLGFDETFLRMWHFYLEYSRAGFASGYLDVHQLVLRREEQW